MENFTTVASLTENVTSSVTDTVTDSPVTTHNKTAASSTSDMTTMHTMTTIVSNSSAWDYGQTFIPEDLVQTDTNSSGYTTVEPVLSTPQVSALNLA